MPDIVNCNLCGSQRYYLLFNEAGYEIVKCSGCGFIFTNPQPTHEELEKQYLNYFADIGWFSLKSRGRTQVFQQVISLLKKFTQEPGKILDVGCATGEFLELVNQQGWEIYGTELSQIAGEISKTKFGERVHIGTVQSAAYKNGYFDVITYLDTLEHIRDPKSVIRESRRILKPGGLLIIRVPNVEFHLFKTSMYKLFGQKQFIGLCPPEHLNHFSTKTISLLLRDSGFSLLHVGVGEAELRQHHLFNWLKKLYVLFAMYVLPVTKINVGNILLVVARRNSS